MLVERGAYHCDADKLVHRLYDPGTPGFERVVEAFGEEIVGPDGFIDRKVLGAKVFGKPMEMAKLTRAIGSITDAVKGEIERWRAELGPNDVAVMEAVNLMEAGYARWCDQMWLVGVSDDIARARLLETRGMSEAEANQRLASMRPFEQRAAGADWSYLNNGTVDDLRAAVNQEFERIFGLHQAGELAPSVFHPWWAAFLEQNKDAIKAAGVKVEEKEAAAEQ
jgi:dephospho-CoA kinase